MGKLLDGYCRLLKVLMAASLAVMVVLVFGNVVLRYGFNSGIPVSEELSRWIFLWMTFFGATVALRERSHLGTDILVSRLPPLARRLCLLVGQVLMLFVIWLVLEGSWQQAKINLSVMAPVTGAPVAIFYATGVVFAVAGGLILLLEMFDTITGRLPDDQLFMSQAGEEAEQIFSSNEAQPHTAGQRN